MAPPPESEETKMINFYDVIEYCKHLGKSGKILKLVQSHIVWLLIYRKTFSVTTMKISNIIIYKNRDVPLHSFFL